MGIGRDWRWVEMAALVGGSALITLAAIACALVLVPPDVFDDAARKRHDNRSRPRWLHVVAALGRNLLGGALVLVGILLSFPGVPGPGIALAVLGLALLDIPGKRRVLRWVVRKKRILGPINRLRARFGRSPFVAPAS